MRTSAILARVVAILAEQEEFILMIVHVVGEVWALVLRVAGVLVQLEFQEGRPLALHAF